MTNVTPKSPKFMHDLGHTRSHRAPDHLLHTPDAFVRATWPGFQGATCVVHASPALGARFTLYTAELAAGGVFAPPPPDVSRFVYVTAGELDLDGTILGPENYALVPPNTPHTLASAGGAVALVFEKPRVGEVTPPAVAGHAPDVVPVPLLGDEDVQVRVLLPETPELDFAVNLMTFSPGARLPQVEVHVMEHGLVMLSGEGIYRLGERWHPVAAGDVIYMAPYCPQWFGALGNVPARYLIYKDWNRSPLL